MPQGEADLVESVQQAIAAKCIDRKWRGQFAVIAKFTSFQIDGEPVTFALFGAARQLGDGLVRDGDCGDAVVRAVRREDVGKRGGDDGAEAGVEKRPSGVLARRA